MQTFVPYTNIVHCVSCLDRQRLGKQRVEAWQILTTLLNGSGRWLNHPATQMWKGCERMLAMYGIACCYIWKGRGYVDNLLPIFKCHEKLLALAEPTNMIILPDWWGGPIHASHRSNLLRKKPEWYKQFGWTEKPDMQYYWPTKEIQNDQDNKDS